jgi:hypothetical protein
MASDAQQEQARKYGQVVAKAWADEAFKQRLLAEPATVLREQGIELPDGLEVLMVENTEHRAYLVLPKPPRGELSATELDQVAGGTCSCACTCQNCVKNDGTVY